MIEQVDGGVSGVVSGEGKGWPRAGEKQKLQTRDFGNRVTLR